MQRVRQMVLVTATLAGCGGLTAVEGAFDQRPSWVDAGHHTEPGLYGRGHAYAVSNPHLRVSSADEDARATVARHVKAAISIRLDAMTLPDALRAEVSESLHTVVYSQAKIIARYYARDRLRQYSLARLDEAGYIRQVERLRISADAKAVFVEAGTQAFRAGGRTR